MKLPEMKYNSGAARQQQVAFGGLNLSDTAGDGELSWSENLSTRRYPWLSPRKGRDGSRSPGTCTWSSPRKDPTKAWLTETVVTDWSQFDPTTEYTFVFGRQGAPGIWSLTKNSGSSSTTTAGISPSNYGVRYTTSGTGTLESKSQIKVVPSQTYHLTADAIFDWDGKFIMAAEGILFIDDEAVTNVTPGPKQFAVMSNRLIVWPDMLCVDLDDNSFTRFDARLNTTGAADNVSFTNRTLTAKLAPSVKEGAERGYGFRYQQEWNAGTYLYGTNPVNVENCFNPSTGQWDIEALEALMQLQWFSDYDYLPSGQGKIWDLPADGVGYIFIPELRSTDAYYIVTGYYAAGDVTDPDTSLYNSEGIYAVISKVESTPWSESQPTTVTITFDLFKVGQRNPLFSGTFSVGDTVDVTGTALGLNDAEKIRISGIADETNTLSFGAEGQKFFRMPMCVHTLAEDKANGNYYISYTDSENVTHTYQFEATEPMEKGWVLYVPEDVTDTNVYVWDKDAKEVKAQYSYTSGTTGTELQAVAYDTSSAIVTVQRNVPELDYICESQNRLWGVSNADRTIYASALGVPWDFWTYEELATDSWSLAVGTDGDFTAICSYQSGVLAWKEETLHKILGSYPAEYYATVWEIPGVQAGSHNGVANINETLLYKGINGVYAYGGDTPRLISATFGNHRYADAAAGDDGLRYYISMREDSTWHLFVYDTLTGLWLREDGTHAVQFTCLEGRLKMLTASGGIYDLDTDSDTDDGTPIQWSATFARYTESDAFERKNYLRALLRLEVGTGGSVMVEVKKDGVWTPALEDALTESGTVIVPIWPNRLDRIEIRLTGTAPCAVLGMAREYTGGSEQGGEAGG